jgi:hydrogenase expression/formation protein HypE
MHDVTRGGILETLLEMTRLSKVGMVIDYEKIPIPNIANRFSKAFKFDPLKMISSGTLVATIPPSKLSDARKALEEKNILYTVVGEVTTGEGVTIRRIGEVRKYQGIHAEEDELARMWTVYKTDAEN